MSQKKDQTKEKKQVVTDEKKQEVTLLLIFNAGWEEDSRKEQGKKVFRAWKGYLFETIDKMHDEQLIYVPRGTKSLFLLEKGQKRADDFYSALESDSTLEVTKETRQDLTLLLISLTGKEEDSKMNPGTKVKRAWKGYDFDILNALQDQNLIYQIPGGKSLLVTDEGMKKCRELQKKYFAEVKAKKAA
jgi:hypothetical protein